MHKNYWLATVKMGGMVAFLGVTVAAWPVSGLLIGKWCVDRLQWPWWIIAVTSLIGFIGGSTELLRLGRYMREREGGSSSRQNSPLETNDPPVRR
ncbi:MAG: hypothetical protein NC924_08570 [Candidatus Omnitrophica bacterium]|nr:hypothetical protein [Candidatus Omnitrophota bacterium]